MSGCPRKALIVGGDSMIGEAVGRRLRMNGWHVIATTRRAKISSNCVPLSLERVVSEGKICLDGYDAIIIAAAIASQAECEVNPEHARLVNVEAPKILGKSAMDRGARVVFLSTNLVLGGDRPFIGTDAPLEAIGAYGRTKAEAEQSLQALPGAEELLTVVRLTKVLDPRLPLLESWRNHGASGMDVVAYSDMVIAPISLAFAAEILAYILQVKVAGVAHCGGSVEVSYADFARAYLERLGFNPALVQPVEGRILSSSISAAPLHASLAQDNNGWSTGIRLQPFKEMLDDLVVPWNVSSQ